MTPSQLANHVKSHVDCAKCDFVGLRAVVSAHSKEVHGCVQKKDGAGKRKVEVSRGVDQDVEDYVAERKKKYKERIMGRKVVNEEDGECEEEIVVESVMKVEPKVVSHPPSNFKKAKKEKEGSFLKQVCLDFVLYFSCLQVRLMKKCRGSQTQSIYSSKQNFYLQSK
jgi:hypothetical protein